MGDREEKTVLFDESMLQQYQKNTTGKSSLVIVDGSGIQEYDLSTTLVMLTARTITDAEKCQMIP